MSNQLEFPIEKFLYNDECLKNDLNILDLTYEKIKDEIILKTKEPEVKEPEVKEPEVKEPEVKEIYLWDNKIDGVIRKKD